MPTQVNLFCKSGAVFHLTKTTSTPSVTPAIVMSTTTVPMTTDFDVNGSDLTTVPQLSTVAMTIPTFPPTLHFYPGTPGAFDDCTVLQTTSLVPGERAVPQGQT